MAKRELGSRHVLHVNYDDKKANKTGQHRQGRSEGEAVAVAFAVGEKAEVCPSAGYNIS